MRSSCCGHNECNGEIVLQDGLQKKALMTNSNWFLAEIEDLKRRVDQLEGKSVPKETRWKCGCNDKFGFVLIHTENFPCDYCGCTSDEGFPINNADLNPKVSRDAWYDMEYMRQYYAVKEGES